jgi:hypothetical protein
MTEDKAIFRGRMDMSGLVGPIWFIGWLFTIGYTHLRLLRALLALILWPYYLGEALGGHG